MKQHLVASGSRLAMIAGALALVYPAAAQESAPANSGEPDAEAENMIVVSGVRQSIPTTSAPASPISESRLVVPTPKWADTPMQWRRRPTAPDPQNSSPAGTLP